MTADTPTVTAAQIDELREAAGKAGRVAPTPWTHSPWHIEEAEDAVRCAPGWIVANTSGGDTAAYIAIANPATIIALLDELKWRTAERAEWVQTTDATVRRAEQAEAALRASEAERERMRVALGRIQVKAAAGNRTFDECSRDLYWCHVEAVATLTKEPENAGR